MAHLKQLTNRAYISKNLKEKLSSLEQYRYSFICAPSGYGKSMVCRTFYKNYPGYAVLWLDGSNHKEIFWKNFCNAVKLVNPDCSNKFELFGFPKSYDDVNELVTLLKSMNSKKTQAILIVENFSEIVDEYLYALIVSIYNSSVMIGMNAIFIAKEIDNDAIIRLIGKDQVGYIGKDEFRFSVEDILDFFKLNELNITDNQGKAIYDSCLGWPYVVEIIMNEYKLHGTFYDAARINNFIGSNIWTVIDDQMRDFLLNISVLFEFTISQCVEHTGLPEKKCIDLIKQSGLIDCNREERVYQLNPLFRKYVSGIFDEKPIEERMRIQVSAAKTYVGGKKYFFAIQLYSFAGKYKEIYEIAPKFQNIYPYLIKENKNLFFDIANHYWTTPKTGSYDMAIIICFAMFLYNEKTMMQNILDDLREDIFGNQLLSEQQRDKYLAEVQYVSCFAGFNDFNKMNDGFKRILNLTKSPVDIIAGQFTFSFGCPSYLSLYHKKAGLLDNELVNIEECAPNYYRITNGHGKGFEALMRAEVLFNRGEIEGAEILCHKASYMAESRDQGSIYIIANYLLAQIAMYRGSNDEYKEYVNNFTKKYDQTTVYSDQLKRMSVICQSMLNINLGNTDKIPEWLTDEKMLEDGSNFITLSYANIIYGKYLLLTEEYHHFLGISGQLLGLSKVYSYIIPRIYTYIYLAIANNEIGETDKSHRFIIEAMELAVHDKLYMPFVMNFDQLEEIIEEVSVNKSLSVFVKTILKYSRVYTKGMKIIRKAGRLLTEYGLTAREAEVAKLAAQRMTNREIATALFIAESTVKSNMKVIFNKLSICSRNDLKNFFDA